MDFTPQTELDAVNQLLQFIGQSPVNSLPESGASEASIARESRRFWGF